VELLQHLFLIQLVLYSPTVYSKLVILHTVVLQMEGLSV
jgi:hypothetical protein